MKHIIAVFIGGSIGTMTRIYLSISIMTENFPYATLIVNLIGSFLLGFLTAFFLSVSKQGWLTAGLSAGLCGGFTTMSTFAGETMMFIQSADYFAASLYMILSIIGGIFASFIGFLLGQNAGESFIRGRKHT
ncbi:fluoride efflux transporter FluC [Metabacillus arenae]|uniref:Fluoride-specific ion channel FluC n=1 Tax=Metabacillus arenae TaxID=2771434 RepID=A0A926RWV4_9BACI|nr:CrcB family protein [Metabacillus arenae]MBD1380326.1 CrcB family protein [Metabacillus arenae]